MHKKCVELCLQHKVNEALDAHVKGLINLKNPKNVEQPNHLNFV